MVSRENRWSWWIILGSLICGGIITLALVPSPAPEIEYLPGEVVIEEVVPQDFLNELARASALNNDLTIERNQLRDKNGRLVRVVTRMQIDSGVVPEPIIITREIEADCDTPEPVRREYRATLDAFQFRGLDDDGDLAYGWRGTIGCDMRRNEGSWLSIVQRPFSLSDVKVVTSVEPEKPRKPQRYFAGVHVAVLKNSTSSPRFFDDYTQYIFSSVDSYRVFGGYRLFPLKKRSVEVGVFADTSSAGLSLGVSF